MIVFKDMQLFCVVFTYLNCFNVVLHFLIKILKNIELRYFQLLLKPQSAHTSRSLNSKAGYFNISCINQRKLPINNEIEMSVNVLSEKIDEFNPLS